MRCAAVKPALLFASWGSLFTPALHAQALPEAFLAGSTLGAQGNAAARQTITTATAQASVPGYAPTAPAAGAFGSAGILPSAAAAAGACARTDGQASGFNAQACNAIQFSQTNPARRADFAIASRDPLQLNHAQILTDPTAIAGQLSGAASGCTVRTPAASPTYQTRLCHQYRTAAASCQQFLLVTAVQTPGCSPGQLLTQITADPCPSCSDYLTYDFTCGTQDYVMHVFTRDKQTGKPITDLGTLAVPGAVNKQIPPTVGPSQVSGQYCYQTGYRQSCGLTHCTIDSTFDNPCQGTHFTASSTFLMPTTTSFVDRWDDQCAALEARVP